MNDYKQLVVWQKSIEFVKETYKLCKLLPKEELFALSSQLKRAAVSVPSNIAEGFGRNSTKDYLRFLNISRGSIYESETQIHIGIELGYFTEDQASKALELSFEIRKMLNALIGKLQSKITNA